MRAIFVRALQVTVEAGASDAEHLGGPYAVTAARFEHAADVLLAILFERQWPPSARRRRGWRLLQILGKIININEVVNCDQGGTGDYIFKFADISRPGVLQQHELRAAAEALNPFLIGGVVLLKGRS